MKVAIVCDWLVGIGGAERVVLELHKMFPQAPIYTSQYDPEVLTWFKDADVRTLWLQRLPKVLRKFLPVFRALAFSRLSLDDYDLVISSSGAEAKGIKVSKNTLHVNYCHSPTHYYWVRQDEYFENPGFGPFDWLAKAGLKLLAGPMKKWDKKAAKRPDFMIANSVYTQANIKKYYGRDSVVIYPPVDTERFRSVKNIGRRGFVASGNQRPYMRRDLPVAAASQLNLPLTVIGNGPEHKKLVKLAGPSIKFLTDVGDSAMPRYFQSAKALIFPAQEDFGITAVEALAAGTPVIAYRGGGALEYIKDGQNGLFFDKQTVESLTDALQKFDGLKYSHELVANSAKLYDRKIFQEKIQTFLRDKL